MRFNRSRFSRLRKYVPWARKAYRPTGRYKKTNRIIRKALRRRPRKPEVKFANKDVTFTLGSTALKNTIAISPDILARGTSVNDRVGSSVMLRYVKIRWFLSMAEEAIPANETSNNFVRVIFWTPRVDKDTAQTYIDNGAVTFLTTFDHNVLTVHKDYTTTLGWRWRDTATNTFGTDAVRSDRIFRTTVPFPRHAKFTSVGTETEINTLDEDKDVLYCTVFRASSTKNIVFAAQSHTTYTDA
ncbi:capsid protein [Capybara virus 8_cap1_36]|nr:capsid protein [Capybara virus 8_cap1_36]